MTKISFSFKFEGLKKIEPFSQGTDGSINLRYESLTTVDYKHKEIPILLSLMKSYG